MQFVNTSAYRFVPLSTISLPILKNRLKETAQACELKGTILLSTEGINSFLSGTRPNIEHYKTFLSSISAFKSMTYQESLSNHQPFSRMLVRLKKEIISMGRSEIKPEQCRAPYISPIELKRGYEAKEAITVLDIRNDYETRLGTFQEAITLDLETFRDFPDTIALLPEHMKEKPIVTVCTGGIRCEKAAQYMLNIGFKTVYQLRGGILNYFAQCGSAYYQGECFVFDKRVAVDSALNETETAQCYGCREVFTIAQQQQPCPNCGTRSLLSTQC